MYRVVVLLLFCLTIVLSLPEYFTAFKYEKLLIGNETECFISRYEFKTKIVQNDTGEDFSNYLPTGMYDSPCYSGYKHNEMNFIRDEYENYYLVHCLFFPDDNQTVICDMFDETGSRRIVDVQCNNPKLTGRMNPSFYIADYLTGENPNEFLYGDSIMYTENIEIHDSDKNVNTSGEQLVCGKQIGYVPFDTVIDDFINDGFNYWDSYLGEGYNFDTPGKRLLFRGRNHLINTEDGLLKYGNLNDELRIYISKAEYDMFINLDLTDYSFIFPKQKHDGLIVGNNTEEGFIVTNTNESFPEYDFYTELHDEFLPSKTIGSLDENGTYEYHWNRQNREFVLIRYKKCFDRSVDGLYSSQAFMKIPGFDFNRTVDVIKPISLDDTVYQLVNDDIVKTFLHPSFKFHSKKTKFDLFVFDLEGGGPPTTFIQRLFSNEVRGPNALSYHCVAYDPIYKQYLEFDQVNYTIKPFDINNVVFADPSERNQTDLCYDFRSSYFFGRYPIMRTNLGLDHDDYTWLSVHGDGKYDDVLKKYKPRFAFEEIIFYKFISQQIRPTPKE